MKTVVALFSIFVALVAFNPVLGMECKSGSEKPDEHECCHSKKDAHDSKSEHHSEEGEGCCNACCFVPLTLKNYQPTFISKVSYYTKFPEFKEQQLSNYIDEMLRPPIV